MFESGYYPPGAEFDPRAPYNQPDYDDYEEDPDDYDYESDERDDYLQEQMEELRLERYYRE